MRSRHARSSDLPDIMSIIGQAKQRLKNIGIDQWQDGYPNEESICNDIAKRNGYVVLERDSVVAYAAILFEDDPYYARIDGRWLSDNPYVVVHRIAVHDDYTRHGVAQYILSIAERKATRLGTSAFRIDTHQGNHAMRNLIRKHGFTLCGIVQVRDGKRLAYEKSISPPKV